MASPALSFTVTLPAIPLVQGEQARAILLQEVGSEVTGVVEAIAGHARENVHVGVSGILRASIGTRVTLGVDASTLVLGEVFTGAQAPYAVPVEEGSRPHWPPWGPGSDLRLWVVRVLGDERKTYLVARKISRVGTSAQHYMARALDAVEPTIPGRMQGAVDRAAVRIAGGA